MTAFLSALGSGVSAKKILDYLIRKSPELAPKISKALASGITADKVLKFFSKDQNFEKLKSSMEQDYPMENNSNPLVQAENVRGKNLGSDMASGLQRNAPALLGGIGALGAGMALRHALPNPLKDSIPRTEEKIQETPLQPPLVNNPVNQTPNNISQVINPLQDKGISNPKEYLEKHGLLDKVKSLLKAGNTPESTAAALGIKRSGEAKIDPELLKNIEEYAKTAQEQPQELAPMESPSQKLDEVQQETERPIEQPKIEKKSIVSSPQGVGEVKEIRNGQAIIDVDGKLHKVKEEELEASPLPEKELADLYDDLIKGIESETGEDVSRMVQWAGYNPETNTLQFLPHTGKLYKYGNISEEDAALLTDILSTRKSSGENFIGAWKAGSKSPIGAALSKLIRKLQSERGGKGNEYEETHEPIYSAYEPAIEAKKRRKKKK